MGSYFYQAACEISGVRLLASGPSEKGRDTRVRVWKSKIPVPDSDRPPTSWTITSTHSSTATEINGELTHQPQTLDVIDPALSTEELRQPITCSQNLQRPPLQERSAHFWTAVLWCISAMCVAFVAFTVTKPIQGPQVSPYSAYLSSLAQFGF